MTPSILCVIDFTNASRKVLEWAATEASRTGASLTVVYPYRLIHSNNGARALQTRAQMNDDAILKFEQVAREILNGYNIEYEFKPEVGFLKDRIYAHNHRILFSLMVIGQKMANANREELEEMIELIRSPLVIVPD